jgi:thymidylate synthase (FAD)
MNILRNAGTHKIFAIMQGPNGESPLELIELAGRTAYQSRDKITPGSANKFIHMLIEKGHESVLEHSAMTVQFDNVSRGFTHELVRHRLMAITQESTRYVDESDFNVVVPPHQNEDHYHISPCIGASDFSFSTWMDLNEKAYRQLRKAGWPAQDARQVLPIAIKSQIVCTTNFREWRHILKMRTAQNAHWEIRRVMIQLLADVRQRIPIVFDDIAPGFTKKEAEDWGWGIRGIEYMSKWCNVSNKENT